MRPRPSLALPSHSITKSDRAAANRQRPLVVWLTGLSGSGKSTLAELLERSLVANGHRCYAIDGDRLRQGLNRDLGFGELDRIENIRRAGELCKLLVDAGLVVIAAFISPFKRDRAWVRQLLEPGEFFEVYLDASLAMCEARDPKGLYRRARAGEIKQFTGIDSPYEPPEAPELVLNTGHYTAYQCIELMLNHLQLAGRAAHPDWKEQLPD